jgi:hypothetical protein
MSWGIGDRVGVAVGIGNIATFLARARQSLTPLTGNLLTEASDNLVQEDGSFILV